MARPNEPIPQPPEHIYQANKAQLIRRWLDNHHGRVGNHGGWYCNVDGCGYIGTGGLGSGVYSDLAHAKQHFEWYDPALRNGDYE